MSDLEARIIQLERSARRSRLLAMASLALAATALPTTLHAVATHANVKVLIKLAATGLVGAETCSVAVASSDGFSGTVLSIAAAAADGSFTGQALTPTALEVSLTSGDCPGDRCMQNWRFDLGPGDTITGPALIAEHETSTAVPAGFDAVVLDNGALMLTARGAGG